MRVLPSRGPLPWPRFLSVSLLLLASLVAGCSGGSIAVDLNTIAAISTSTNTLRVNQTLQLSSKYISAGLPMNFYVNGILGGNSQVGTISNSGLYTAPALVPTPYTVQITASISKYPNAVPGSVSVQVWNPIPALSNVNPGGFSEGTTTVIVNGSQFVFGSQISWNGVLTPTTYVSATELVAQIDAPIPGTYPLAVTNPNPGSATTSPLALLVGPGKVVLKLETYAGTDVRVSNSLNLGLTVSGTTNTAVTLQINGIPDGNPQIGTAVANPNGTITYSAPPVVPTPNNVVQLTITSVDNPTVSITQNISVLNPIPILDSASPMNFNRWPAFHHRHRHRLAFHQWCTGADERSSRSHNIPERHPTHRHRRSDRSPAISICRFSIQAPALQPRPISSRSSTERRLSRLSLRVTPRVSWSRLHSARQTTAFIISASIGFQPWLDEQFALPPTPQETGS